MAFNLGAFASGAAKGYLSSKELEEREKDREMRQQALDIQKAQAAREEERYRQEQQSAELLKSAYTPTEGGVSTQDIIAALPIGQRAGETETTPENRQAFQTAFNKLTPQQQAAVLQGYGSANTPGGQAAAAIPELKAAQLGTTTVRKGEDGQTYAVQPVGGQAAMDRFIQLAGASGNPLAVEKALEIQGKQQQIELGRKQLTLADMSINSAKREENYKKNLDAFSERTLKTQDILHDLPNVGLKEAPNLVNGALKDFGLTAKYIEPTGDAAKKQAIGGMQMGSVEVRDAKGKVVGTFNSVAEIQNALNGQMGEYHNKIASELVQMLPNAADRIKFMNEAQTLLYEKAKIAIQERQAGAAEKNAQTSADELKAKMDAGLFGAQTKQAVGAANASNAHAALYSNMAALSKSNAEAGKVMKPYIDEFAKLSPEDQAGAKGQSVLLEAATAAAKKTGDVTGILNALKKPDRAAVTAEERTAAYQDLREAGSNPDAIAAVKEKWPNVFGEDPMLTLYKNAQGNTNKAKGGDNKTKSAIPTKTTSGSHSPSDIYKQPPKQDEKALRAEWVDLSQRQKLVGGSPEAKAKGALRMLEIEQTLNGAPQSNKFIKTN